MSPLRKKLVGKTQPVFIPLLWITIVLVGFGLLILYSAALGKLGAGSLFIKTMIVQLIGIVLGAGIIFAAVRYKQFDYRLLYKKGWSLYIFVFAIIFQLIVFTPLGVSLKGARRWIDIGVTTLQPSEFLKIALVLFFASLLVGFKKEIKKLPQLVLLLGVSAGICGVLMLLIRDKGTLMVMGTTIIVMLLVSTARWWHTIGLIVLGAISLGGFVFALDSESYARQRIETFLGINYDPLGAGYQVDQAITTVGSGGIVGRGYGQSLQKHGLLPESLNDSIFAIVGEELGFVGSVLMILLFSALVMCGLHVARNASDLYGMYVAMGLTVSLGAQAFFNIMAMIGMFPLSGMPLPFVSKGGTALIASLMMVAILLNISRFKKRKRVS